MSSKELPNRAEILEAREERKRLRELNTKKFNTLIIEHHSDGKVFFTVSDEYDVYDAMIYEMDVPEVIEFLQRVKLDL